MQAVRSIPFQETDSRRATARRASEKEMLRESDRAGACRPHAAPPRSSHPEGFLVREEDQGGPR